VVAQLRTLIIFNKLYVIQHLQFQAFLVMVYLLPACRHARTLYRIY
jgi:hypothetical protein